MSCSYIFQLFGAYSSKARWTGHRLLAVLALAFICVVSTWSVSLRAEDGPQLLVATEGLRSAGWTQTVLVAVPHSSGGHIGLILNRPTVYPLSKLFPEHKPSEKVIEPVYFGGPFNMHTVVALVRRAESPAKDGVALAQDLFLVFNVATIDQIIESTPNEARYFVGFVLWRPGELDQEMRRGFWSTAKADPQLIMRKDTQGMWKELARNGVVAQLQP